MFTNILNIKKIRFLIGGVIAVAINIVAVIILVEFLGLTSSFLKNIANILSMEIGTVSSFLIYRFWVWEIENKIEFKQLLHQFFIYHLTLGIGIAIRSFIIFPVLEWLGVNYVLNSAMGIILFTFLNYFINGKLFK